MSKISLEQYFHTVIHTVNYSLSVALSALARNFHSVKVSVLVLYNNDTMSEICSNVLIVEAVAISFKNADEKDC